MSNQVDAVRASGTAYRHAVEAGDIDAVMRYWTEDGIWMPPGRPSIVGKDAIRDAYQELFFDSFDVQRYAILEEEIIPTVGWAFERARFKISLRPKGGADVISWEGKYIILWQAHESGLWRMARAINNSDMPEGHAGQ